MRKNDDRLKVLQSLAILDTAPEIVFDDLTRAVAQTFGVPIAMVSFLDADRDWFKPALVFQRRNRLLRPRFASYF